MRKNLNLIMVAFCLLLVFGISGYYFIEGWTLAESLYMTMITITTTGYQEVQPLSVEGRFFTMVLLSAGVLTLAFLTNVCINDFLSMDHQLLRRQKMKTKIASLKDHIIVCGFGRMGKSICQELDRAGVTFVVLDKVEINFKEVPAHYLWLLGDATSDELLMDAGIKKARLLVSMVDSDADSLYLTLAAGSLHSSIRIIARASNESAKLKLIRAGADEVVQPLILSSRKVARMVLGQESLEEEFFHEKGSLSKEKVVSSGPWEGKTLEEWENLKKHQVIAVISKKGEVWLRPEMGRPLQEGDTLLTSRKLSVSGPKLQLVA